MAYYDVTDRNGIDFVCLVRDHSKNTRSELLVRATDERLARLSFKGERTLSLLTIRAK